MKTVKYIEIPILGQAMSKKLYFLFQYPYSTREVVNIVKHLEKFPDEGLGNVVRNVFDFDSYNKETKESLNEILRKHGM